MRHVLSGIVFGLMLLASCTTQTDQALPPRLIEVEYSDDTDWPDDSTDTDSADAGGRLAIDRESGIWQITYASGLFEKNMNISTFMYATRAEADANLMSQTKKPLKKATIRGNAIALYKTKTLYYGFHATTISDATNVITRQVIKTENTGTKPLFWLYRGALESFNSGVAKLKVKPKKGSIALLKTVWVPINSSTNWAIWYGQNPNPLVADRAHVMQLFDSETMAIPAGRCVVAFVDASGDAQGVVVEPQSNRTMTLKPTFE